MIFFFFFFFFFFFLNVFSMCSTKRLCWVRQRAAKGGVAAPKDDPRRVVIVKMRVMFEERPDGHIEYDLDTKEPSSRQ
jgi:hypothetical protein